MTTRPLPRRLAGVAAAAFAVLTVAAGCGGTDHGSSSGGHNAGTAASTAASTQPGAEHNDADVTFAQSMIPHHQQALEMASMAETKASNAQVKTLASKIKEAQGPEIEEMTTLLQNWGVAMSMPSGEAHGGMPGMGSMPGMMTAEEMTKFAAATGAGFDRMFLEMMIRHHQGAIEMAKTEQQQGADPAAKALAKSIEQDQATEIAEMQKLLNS
jgi:uncharacterized protein (DUF305 family)